ncbi:hypothetical protein WJX74_006914 [Apatococcus lobatus]|uniref:Major facilitator superfamily (MFS) profile domain-containing protein n=1 Tax=Apatococcus lobatus TaxID=904363 RepID=A0AAW1QBF3_9CHLO
MTGHSLADLRSQCHLAPHQQRAFCNRSRSQRPLTTACGGLAIKGLQRLRQSKTLPLLMRTQGNTRLARHGLLQVSASTAGGGPGSKDIKQHSLGPVLWCVAIATLGAFSFGYHASIVNGPLGAIASELGFKGDAAKAGLVVSSLLAGAAVGSLSGSTLADSLGRKNAFAANAVPLLAGALLSATASSLVPMVAGRAIAGFGIGLASALVPLYISEVAPADKRGTLGSVNQLVICFGILGALVVNVILPAADWRKMFYFAAIPPALVILGLAKLKESPRWLASKGRAKEASQNAEALWGPSGPAQLTGDAVSAGTDKAVHKATQPGLGDLLKNRGAMIGTAMFLFQQLAGINAIIYFSSDVFAKAGVQSGAVASAVVGGMNVVGTIVAASAMDKAGRKQLLRLSFGGMGLSMLAMVAGLSLSSLAHLRGSIALWGTLAYVLTFSLGAGPVPGLLVPEITPSRLRGQAVSLALGVHWVANFAIGQLFLPAVEKFGLPGVYLFFAAICFITVGFTQSSVPETKGKSLEEVEALLA